MQDTFSIWSAYYIDLSPRDMVLELERNGIRVSELSDEHGSALLEEGNDPAATGRAFREFAAAHGVRFPQGHLWLGIQLLGGDADTIPVLKRWIELFEAAGVQRMVFHADDMLDRPANERLGARACLEANIAELQKLVPFLAGKDVTICLENLGGCLADADGLMEMAERLGPNFAVCLDTGHLNLVGGDQRAFIERCGGRLKALHLDDNEGASDQHLMPFGKGNVNFKEVFSALRAAGYDGIYNYEIPGERNCPLEIRAKKLRYLREVHEYLLSH